MCERNNSNELKRNKKKKMKRNVTRVFSQINLKHEKKKKKKYGRGSL